MSMSVTEFTCDRCNFSASETIVWGRFYYQLSDGSLIPLERHLGWCCSCKTLVPVESDISRYEAELSDLEAELSDLENHSFLMRLFMGSEKRKVIEYKKELIKEKREIIGILRSRKTPPRCLKCSSAELIPHTFHSAPDDKLEKHYPTGFVHPGCGGNVMASNSGFRIRMQKASRAYTTEGILVKEWHE